MALRTGNGLETMSLVVTERQAAELRRIKAERSSDSRRVSVSDVAREVLDLGLAAVMLADNTDSITTAVSNTSREGVAA